MKTKLYFTSIIAFLIAFQVSAQNIATQTIQWNSPSWFEASAGASFETPTTVTSSPGSIEWKYQGDSIKYNMTIRKSTGSWTNVAGNGSIMLEADSGSDSAIVEFKKTNDRTYIRIVLAKPEETLIYELQVTNTQEL
jgi:hypothetical protein